MARVLVVDTDICGLGLCMKFMGQGNDVQLFSSTKSSKAGEGLVKKISNLRSGIDWADIVIHTLCDESNLLDKYRSKKIIWASSKEGNKLELDREYGQNILKQHGISTVPYQNFDNYDKAIDYIIKNNKRVVLKPNDNDKTELTYVSKDAEDAVCRITEWKDGRVLKKVDFIVQDFISGIEMGVESWFTPAMGFCKYVFETFEFKSLLNDKKGPNTGEMGTVGRYTSKSLLADKVLFKLSDYLKSINHTGTVCVSCIIDDKGDPHPLEISPRLGWPCTSMMLSMHKNDLVPWMVDAYNGVDSLKVSTDVSCVLVVAQPPFPYLDLEKYYPPDEVPITIPDELLSDVYFFEVKRGKCNRLRNGRLVKEDSYITAGTYLLNIVSSGKTISECQKSVYGKVGKIKIPSNLIYRTDIGSRLEKELPKLKSLGYCTDLEYGSHFEYSSMYEGFKGNRSEYVSHLIREQLSQSF